MNQINRTKEYSYELTEVEKRELTRALCELDDPLESNTYSQYKLVVIPGTNPISNLARELHRKVFDEKFDKIDHSADFMDREYGAYESDSLFFILFDTSNNQVVGSIRIIDSDNNKSITDLAEHTLDLELLDLVKQELASSSTVWDIATLAVHSSYRGGAVGASLYYALYSVSRLLGVSMWVSIMDPKPLNLLRKVGIPLKACLKEHEIIHYLSYPSLPVYAIVDDISKSVVDEACFNGTQGKRKMISQILIGLDAVPANTRYIGDRYNHILANRAIDLR